MFDLARGRVRGDPPSLADAPAMTKCSSRCSLLKIEGGDGNQ